MAEKLATERLYVDAAGQAVAEDDPAVAFLVAAVGQPVPAGYKAAKAPVNKAVKAPANKASKK